LKKRSLGRRKSKFSKEKFPDPSIIEYSNESNQGGNDIKSRAKIAPTRSFPFKNVIQAKIKKSQNRKTSIYRPSPLKTSETRIDSQESKFKSRKLDRNRSLIFKSVSCEN